jgi:hypothetical protein
MKINHFLPIALLCLAVSFAACLRAPEYPIEPRIEFMNQTKTTMRQGFGTEDSVYINISFTDGDGDLGGISTAKDSLNVYITDLRNNKAVEQTYRLPFIPEPGARNGISGEIRFLMYTTCCLSLEPCRPTPNRPLDTLVYEFYIKDRAGHASNKIKTQPILLQCK